MFMKISNIINIIVLICCFNNVNTLIVPHRFIKDHPKIAINSINFITQKLPEIDSFGHKNLEFNREIIPYILNDDNIPTHLKVNAVTSLIKFSQLGDNFGGWVLDKYLHIITYLVHLI